MAYKIIVDHPELGDQDLYIHGLGTFHNNTETVVPNSKIRDFRNAHSTVEVTTGEDGKVTHMPSRGAHPVDLEIYGVRVEKVESADTVEAPEADSTGEGVNQ